jgi:vancomycin resistance protein YoaR
MTAHIKRLTALSVAALVTLGGCAHNTEIPAPRSRTRFGTEAAELTVQASGLIGTGTRKNEPVYEGEFVITSPDMRTTSELLGTFSTKFAAWRKNRSSNIKKASDKINSVVVKPGEVFSYNKTVGPTSRKNGYKLATIFIKGEKYEGYGGGVCQVSSTLYNAAANAGLEIIERHDHSRPVPYVEKGKEAATSYGGIDFKFKNNKPFPIKILSEVEDGTVSVTINAV